MGHLNKEIEMENAQHPAAAAQQSADAAFSAAWKAARTSGGACFATDETGLHMYVQRHAPDEYAEYQRILRAAQAALRGTKYEGSITS